jgi:hypothetical protein
MNLKNVIKSPPKTPFMAGWVGNKKPQHICRGFEYYSNSIGHAITIPERSLNATTNICLSSDSLFHKFAGEFC